MKYNYRMVQLSRNIKIKASEEKGDEAAVYLQTIVNDHAKQGWEFYRVDTIGVITEPGCSSLFGKKEEMLLYYVATFRAPG
jgi:methylphosphotriester-DNA--protein-cysteine methyltransferase